MMKKIILLFTIFTFAFGAFFYWKSQNNTEEWQTYNKVDHDKIESYPTTPKEVKKYKLPDLKEDQTKRVPAALQATSKETRELINPLGKKINKNISTHNKVSDQWKERLGQNLLRFLRPDTTVFVKKQRSVSLIEKQKLRHAEIVIVQLKSPEGRRFSYNAYVDSESGIILQTWNRTIHEFYGQKTKRIAPSGMINSDGSTQF